jgi:hypothetical protein
VQVELGRKTGSVVLASVRETGVGVGEDCGKMKDRTVVRLLKESRPRAVAEQKEKVAAAG